MQGHLPLEHPVVGTPEATGAALGEQVEQAVAAGEEVAGSRRVRHLALLGPAEPGLRGRSAPLGLAGLLWSARLAGRRGRPRLGVVRQAQRTGTYRHGGHLLARGGAVRA